jgi:hypothetical protein
MFSIIIFSTQATMPKSERLVRFCQLHIYASETVAEEKTVLEEKLVHRVSSHGGMWKRSMIECQASFTASMSDDWLLE